MNVGVTKKKDRYASARKMSYTYDPNRPLTNGSKTPPPTVAALPYSNPNPPIYQTLGNAPYTPGKFAGEPDVPYMFSSQSSSKAYPGYRSVSMLNPQATEIQRGHVGTQTNGDIIVQVRLNFMLNERRG